MFQSTDGENAINNDDPLMSLQEKLDLKIKVLRTRTLMLEGFAKNRPNSLLRFCSEILKEVTAVEEMIDKVFIDPGDDNATLKA